jgi:hypothetical protein
VWPSVARAPPRPLNGIPLCGGGTVTGTPSVTRKSFFIITAPLVEWLRAQAFPMPQPPIRFYPDGSLWSDDYNVLMTGKNPPQGVEQLIHHRLPGAYTSCRFRALAAFGGDYRTAPQYGLLYPGSCTWMGSNELGVLMYPGIFKEATPDEYDLRQVRVLVRLRRKMSSDVAEELAAVVKNWFLEIGSVGVFGEAGVRSISPVMRVAGTDAGFELDAAGSGQETLNTLYLAILNWGMAQCRPLTMIGLAPGPGEKVFHSDLSLALR